MADPKYPLDPLLRLRESAALGAAKELAASVRAHEAAAIRRSQAARDLAAERAEQARVRAAERAELERGELVAADLARAAEWELGARRVEENLASIDASRSEEERAAAVRQESERANLAQRRADADVIDKDKARHGARVRAVQLSKEEETAQEAWRRRS